MASCWICLDDEADQDGNPPVRDCSCRGDDAGFVHLSCIVNYARTKSIETDDDPDDFIDPCMIHEQYPACDWHHIVFQHSMLESVINGGQMSKERQEEIIETSLSLLNQLKLSMQSGQRNYPYNIQELISSMLCAIGQYRLNREDLTEDEAKKGLLYLDSNRNLCPSGESRIIVDAKISFFKAVCIKKFGAQEAFGKPETVDHLLDRFRNSYRVIVEEEGEVVSLDMGANFALILVQSKKRIEAWRLMKRLIATSKQHLGREHHVTKSLENTSAICKSLIIVTLRSLGLSFEAIGYEDDRYVLRGPVGVDKEKEETLRVAQFDVILGPAGTPVVCHGLKNKAACLSGKIGDIRSFEQSTGRYGVYFEDESIKPKSVKPRNLRIIFELPDN